MTFMGRLVKGAGFTSPGVSSPPESNEHIGRLNASCTKKWESFPICTWHPNLVNYPSRRKLTEGFSLALPRRSSQIGDFAG